MVANFDVIEVDIPVLDAKWKFLSEKRRRSESQGLLRESVAQDQQRHMRAIAQFDSSGLRDVLGHSSGSSKKTISWRPYLPRKPPLNRVGCYLQACPVEELGLENCSIRVNPKREISSSACNINCAGFCCVRTMRSWLLIDRTSTRSLSAKIQFKLNSMVTDKANHHSDPEHPSQHSRLLRSTGKLLFRFSLLGKAGKWLCTSRQDACDGILLHL